MSDVVERPKQKRGGYRKPLTADERAAILYGRRMGLKIREIARDLSMSPGTVGMVLQKGA